MTIRKQSSTLYLGPGDANKKLAKLTKAMSAKIGKGNKVVLSKGFVSLREGKAWAPTTRSRTPTPKSLGRKTLRVGVWDIDVHAGFLYRALDNINACQRLFSFHPIEVTPPVGLTATGERTRTLVRAKGLDATDASIADNALASDIFEVAAPIRDRLDLDMLVAIIAPMIMDLEPDPGDGEVGWNYFSTSLDNLAIVSAYELRGYAHKSKRPFEACLAALIAAQVLQEAIPSISFHTKPKGCVFDYCGDRDDIVKGLKAMRPCAESLEEIPQRHRQAVQDIFKTIAEYER